METASGNERKELAARFLGTLELLGIGEDWRDGVRIAIEAAFETTALLDRLTQRLEDARAAKDWVRADAIKASLVDAGVQVMIGQDGVKRVLTPDFDPAKLEALK